MLADNHALVDILLAADEEFAAVFKVKDRIGHRDPILHGDQNASATAWDCAFVRRPGVKYAVQNARAAGVGHEFALIADQAARRHMRDDARLAGPCGFHLCQVTLTKAGQLFNHNTRIFFIHIDGHFFDGL